MKDTFSGYHPLVNLLYFLAVIGCAMFLLHPLLLGISLVCGGAYAVCLNGRRGAGMLLRLLPLYLVIALANPLVNASGTTIWLYVNDRPVTWEATLYGLVLGALFLSVLLWFSCYNTVMSTEKFLFLFGKLIPAVSLMLTMVMRFVPRFRGQIGEISFAQKCVGRDVSQGKRLQKLKSGGSLLLTLTNWSMENAIVTADSMRSRGYGAGVRSSFSRYRFSRRDVVVLLWMALLFAAVVTGLACGAASVRYFPTIQLPAVSGPGLLTAGAYGLLLLLPVYLNIGERVRWHYLRSGI